MIQLAKPQIGRLERRAVSRVLKSLNLAQGPEVKSFESEFSELVDGRECVAVNSGTSALHLCLLSLGLGVGDEVIVPSFTFAASANVIRLVGATPVFVDINPKTYCADVTSVESAITPKTKAIIVVHLYGLMADMNSIMEVAKRFNLLVIEDSAQAHLADIEGKTAGSFGDAAAFSFYPTKNMSTSEGGMAVFRNLQESRICRLLRNQGMEKRYQNEIIGFNLRMTEIEAAIGRVQLRKLESFTSKRIENAEFLSQRLESSDTPVTPVGYRHVFHQYTVRIRSNRDEFMGSLRGAGIGCDVYYPTPVHKLKPFDIDSHLEQTELASDQVLSLPVHPGLSKRELRKVASEFNRIVCRKEK
jgi:perosamine synthetase